MPQLKVQNFYSTALTSDIVGTGDTSFTVTVAPTFTSGFLVISPNNAALREIVYFHNVVGSTISVRAENRGQGGTTARSHTSQEPVAMKDIAEIFNMFSDSISQCFFVEKTGGITIKVWGGTVFYNGNPVTVADTALTLADNQTNYIKYSYPTNTISVDTTNSGNIKAKVIVTTGVITSIEYYVAKESYIDFTVSLTGALPIQTGNAGKSLITDGTNAYWGINNLPRVGLTASSIVRTNASGDEIFDSIETITPLDSDTVIMQRSGNIKESSFVGIKESMGINTTFASYESGIVSGDLVGNVAGILIKCVTENANSIDLNAGTIVAPSQVALDSTKILFVYSLTNVVKAVVGTLSGNTISLGTVVDIYTGSAINDISTALIGTDKVVIAYGESTAGALIRTKVVTIAGTVITQGAEYSQSLNNGYVGNYTLGDLEVIKLRTDAFVWNIGNNGNSRNYVRAFTVSGTTITAGTVYADYIPTGAGSWVNGRSQMAYLSDNHIAFYTVGGTLATDGPTAAGIYIWTINPANTTISATNTYNPAVPNNAYLARYDDNTVVASFESTNTNVFIYGISVTGSILFDNGATRYLPLVPIMTGVFATYEGGTLIIYQHSTAQRTIVTGINFTTAPTKIWHTNSYFQVVLGRLLYVSGNHGTTRFVNLGITFYLGCANNATGGVIIRGVQTRTTIHGLKYYIQSDGSIGLINTGIFVGKGLGTAIVIGN